MITVITGMTVHVYFYTEQMEKMSTDAPDISTYTEQVLKLPDTPIGSVHLYKSLNDTVLGVVAFQEKWSCSMSIEFNYTMNLVANILNLKSEQIHIHLPNSNNKYLVCTNRKNTNDYYKQFEIKQQNAMYV